VIAADSLLQKTFTEQSRDVFTRNNLDDKVMTMASTGHNQKWIPACDDTLNSTSRRYGTETFP
jgi:L-rhamnose mutarotase